MTATLDLWPPPALLSHAPDPEPEPACADCADGGITGEPDEFGAGLAPCLCDRSRCPHCWQRIEVPSRPVAAEVGGCAACCPEEWQEWMDGRLRQMSAEAHEAQEGGAK